MVASVLLVPVVELLLLPLIVPRGEYGFGHYRLRDLAAGIPLALACAAAWAVALAPRVRRRRLIFALACWWVVIVGAVAVVDITVAAWRIADQGSRVESDPERIWRRPARARVNGRYGLETAGVSLTFDEQGFRNPPGVTRADLVFLGDSFTDAPQVEEADTFVRRVERSTGLRAVNLATTAYGPQQELAVLREHALRYHPRVVVWQLFEGNDWADALQFAAWRRGERRLDTEWTKPYVEASPVARALARTLRAPGATLRYVDGTTARFRLRLGGCPSAGDDRDAPRQQRPRRRGRRARGGARDAAGKRR